MVAGRRGAQASVATLRRGSQRVLTVSEWFRYGRETEIKEADHWDGVGLTENSRSRPDALGKFRHCQCAEDGGGA